MKKRENHGMYNTPEYQAWADMKARCNNSKHPWYRGIGVCSQWDSFTAFIKDMGRRPDGASLGRLNNNGHYCPSNCSWQTATEQQNNTRHNHLITFRGITQNLMKWSRELNMPYGVLASRILTLGWPIEKAFTVPRLKRFEKVAL